VKSKNTQNFKKEEKHVMELNSQVMVSVTGQFGYYIFKLLAIQNFY